MCLFPLKINNPTKRINLQGGQQLRLSVPCGRCADCKKTKRLEWHFRSFHQTDSTIKNGGYVYFDTLTYRPKDVPHLSRFIDVKEYGINDYMVFDSEDWRNFLKNLRRQLEYHFKGANFKYFLTSEYGTDDNFTHRPHYHVLFFVNSKKAIHPFSFSRLVAKCWPYGLTDGLPYKETKYVAKHIYGVNVGFGLQSDYLSVCSYVSKYVTKDSSYQKTIDERLKVLRDKLDDDDTYNVIKRSVDMFHRQSQGYGLSYITDMSNDEYINLFASSSCRIMDKDKVKLTIPLPLFYKRKLFYKVVKEDDSVRYVPTSLGKDYLYQQSLRMVNVLERSFYTTYLNATDDDKYHIDRLLNGRTLRDLSVYSLFYRGRVRSFDSWSISPKTHLSHCRSTLTDCEHNLYDWLDSVHTNYYYDNHSLDIDDTRYVHGIPMSYSHLYDNLNLFDTDSITLSYDTFIKQFTFNENSVSDFNKFDELLAWFEHVEKPNNNLKQKTFDFIEYLESILKLFYGK